MNRFLLILSALGCALLFGAIGGALAMMAYGWPQ